MSAHEPNWAAARLSHAAGSLSHVLGVLEAVRDNDLHDYEDRLIGGQRLDLDKLRAATAVVCDDVAKLKRAAEALLGRVS